MDNNFKWVRGHAKTERTGMVETERTGMIENDRKDANGLRKAAKGGEEGDENKKMGDMRKLNERGRLKNERTGVIENNRKAADALRKAVKWGRVKICGTREI